MEGLFLFLGFVREDDPDAFVEIAHDLEPFGNQVGVELGLGENLRVGTEEDGGARPAGRAAFDETCHRFSLLEPLLPLVSLALGGRNQLRGQGIDHAGPDPMEPPRRPVGTVLELAPRVKGGEDDFQSALSTLGMAIHRYPTAVVDDGDRRVVGVQRHLDLLRVAIHRLIHGVVQDFPDEVVQSWRSDATDVHAGSLTDRVESF